MSIETLFNDLNRMKAFLIHENCQDILVYKPMGSSKPSPFQLRLEAYSGIQGTTLRVLYVGKHVNDLHAYDL